MISLKEFYDVFREDPKTPLTSSFKSAFDKGGLSNSQKQVVIEEKKIKIIQKTNLKLMTNIYIYIYR